MIAREAMRQLDEPHTPCVGPSGSPSPSIGPPEPVSASTASSRRGLGVAASDMLGYAMLLCACVHAGVELWIAPRWTVDDAWITARHADNIARAGVFAFNTEGARVEGVTSLLYTFLGAAASAAGLAPIDVMTWLGIGAYVAIGPALYALGRALRVPGPVAAGLAYLYALIPEQVAHARSGLETQLFVLVEVACAWAFVRAIASSRGAASPLTASAQPRARWRRIDVLVGLCLLACLVRPEGYAVAGVLFAILALRHRRRRAALRGLAWRVGVGLVLPNVAVVVGRICYFDSILPNTFYAKHRSIDDQRLLDLLTIGDDYFAEAGLLAFAAFSIARLLGAPAGRIGPRARVCVLGAVSILAAFGAAYRHKDVMNFSRRFAMHMLPWVFLLALPLVSFAVSRVRSLPVRRRRLVYALLGSTGISCLVFPWHSRWVLNRHTERELMNQHIINRDTKSKPAAEAVLAYERWLGRRPKIVVYPDAGYVPYRTRFYTLDFGRLNDRYLARQAKTPSDEVEYFFTNAPDAAVFSYFGPDKMFNEAAKRVHEDARFAAYRRVGEWRDSRGFGLGLYVRDTTRD